MDPQTITDDNGEVLRLIARTRTTPHSDDLTKLINTDSTTVEVIVSDGRILSRGSQWGHVAMDIDGTIYGMSHNGYDKRPRRDYLDANSYRDSIGVVLRVSPMEKEKMRNELERRKKSAAITMSFSTAARPMWRMFSKASAYWLMILGSSSLRLPLAASPQRNC